MTILTKIYQRLGKNMPRDCALQEVRDTAVRLELEATGYHLGEAAKNLGSAATS